MKPKPPFDTYIGPSLINGLLYGALAFAFMYNFSFKELAGPFALAFTVLGILGFCMAASNVAYNDEKRRLPGRLMKAFQDLLPTLFLFSMILIATRPLSPAMFWTNALMFIIIGLVLPALSTRVAEAIGRRVLGATASSYPPSP